MVEIWKTIDEYPNYQVSNMGRVKNIKTGKLLKPIIGGGNYLQVNLYENGKRKTHKIHKLVSYYFQEICGLYFDGCECDHLDTNRINNNVENLRNVTPLENHNNPLTKQHISKSKIGKPSWGLGKKYNDTHKENISKSLKNKYILSKNPNSKPILQYTLDGKLIRKWECLMDVVNEMGISQPNISLCLTGKHKSAGGFVWKYAIKFNVFDLAIEKVA